MLYPITFLMRHGGGKGDNESPPEIYLNKDPRQASGGGLNAQTTEPEVEILRMYGEQERIT